MKNWAIVPFEARGFWGPVVPGAWADFDDSILTTDSLFEQADRLRRITLIGMGTIGIEIARALARLGLEVAGFDAVADMLAMPFSHPVLEEGCALCCAISPRALRALVVWN